MAVATPFGAPVKRTEDPRFITGAGNFLDDIKLPGMTYASILRSPYAHARIRSIDTSQATAMPGVVAVFTGRDMESELNPLPCAWAAGGASGGEVGGVVNNLNTPRVLATDDVKWTGEGVAVVIAETPEQALDARETIEVDWEPLPTVVDTEGATEAGAPQLHENAPNNVAFTWAVGDPDGTAAAIDGAEVVIKQRLVNQRLIPNPMDMRGAIGRWDPGGDDYTIWMTSQTPHIMRLLIAAFVMGVPEHKIRCISPDVGGAFGTKIFCYPEWALVAWASKRIGGRPVKWYETRSENYQATTHGRDHITYIEVGATKQGEVTGLRVKTYANMGGRLSTIGPGIPTTLYGRVLSGPYKIPNVHCEVIGTYTNTAFVDAYRGAGRPEATYLLERAMDLVADETGIDPAEVRRRNFLQPDAFPYTNPSGLFRSWNGVELEIDSGNYEPAMDRALEMVGYADMAKRRAEAESRGKFVGVGLSTYLEMCGVAPSKWIGLVGEGWGAAMWESANIRVHLTGKTVLTIGTQSHGQGHETTFAQIVAEKLGIAMDDIVVEHSDTSGTPFGYGTYGSRSGAVGGMAAVRAAEKVVEKAKRLAAHMLEANPGDMEFVDGAARVKGSPDKSKTIAEIALAAHVGYDLPEGMEPYLDETAYYDAPNCTWPFGTHVAVVEVDKETGKVDLVQYVAVDDVGKKINPMIVDGQIHGGIAQGVGQALWEGAVYDDEGQLLSGSMMDYAVPPRLVVPEPRARRDGDPVAGQPAGDQGRRRGRRHRQHAGGGERRHRCAQSAWHPSHRHAAHAATGVACDAVGRGGAVVIPASFEYVRVSSVDEALDRLSGDSEAKVLAGGQSLIPLLKFRLAQPGTLVDIGGLRELAGITRDGDGWRIGALTTYREVLDHDELLTAYPLLRDCVEGIGDVQVRNRGTVGGALAHADPAADLAAAAMALDGEVILRSKTGERSVSVADFCIGAFTTAMERRRAPGRAAPASAPGRRRDGVGVARAGRLRLRDRGRGGRGRATRTASMAARRWTTCASA